MINSDYWAQRFTQLEAALHGMGEDAAKDIERQYREAQKQIEADIARWYQRLAANNNISLAEARKFLQGAELKEFKWDVWEYIKYGKENALNGKWMKELENASAKFHISRLEALKIHTQQSLEALFAKQLGTVTSTAAKVFESSYYHTAFEIQKGFGVGWDIAGLNQSQTEKVISKPWAMDEYNFSERIWSNKEKLINEIHGTLTQNIMLGQDPQKAIDAIAKKMNTSKYNAGRLVMTEEAAFASMAQQECYKNLGVEKYEVVETLDASTCETCGALDGKVFAMSEYQVGLTVPPFHPYCRGCTAPYFDDFNEGGERAARDIKTGKTYNVPADMTFEEWKKQQDGGGVDKSTENDIINRDYQCEFAQKIGKEHYDKMHDILDGCGSTDMCDVWEKFEAEIGVADIDAKNRECCDWKANININLNTNSKDVGYSKPYQSVFHESGHAIDMIAGRTAAGSTSCTPNNLYSATYKNGLFPQTIKREVEALVAERDKILKAEFNSHSTDYDWLYSNGYIPTQKYEFFKKFGSWSGGTPKYSKSIAYSAIEKEICALSPPAKADLSDIIGGATQRKISCGYGHKNSYWSKGDWTLATEAFAEMVDSTVANPESLEAIKKYLPDSYEVFLDMIKDLK